MLRLLLVPLLLAASVAGVKEDSDFEPCPPECAYCLNNLAQCSYLQLTCLPSGYWPQIFSLMLYNNALSKLTSISGFPYLRELDISNNRYEVLDLMYPAELNATLKVFRADNNRISSLRPIQDEFTFRQLEIISLANNSILRIENNVLNGVKNLQYFDLSLNPLLHVNLETLEDHFAQGSNIVIDETPLACYCGYKQLLMWATQRGIKLSAKCSSQKNCNFE